MHKIYLIAAIYVFGAFSSENSMTITPDTIYDETISGEIKRNDTTLKNGIQPQNERYKFETLVKDTSSTSVQSKNVKNESDTTPVQISNTPDGNFNPLSYQSRILISGCFHYFNYEKYITSNFVEKNFIRQYGYAPDTIWGEHKSNDYGFLFGLWFKCMKRFYPSGIFVRPQVQICLGPDRYKGIVNADQFHEGVLYTSGSTLKETLLFHVANDLGYCNVNKIVPFGIYSGIRFSYWNRDVVTPFENYNSSDWTSFPLGLILYKPLGPRLALGLDISTDYIVGGDVHSVIYSEDNYQTYYEEKLPFGDNSGYRFEFTAEFLMKKWLSLQITQFVNIYKFREGNFGNAWIESTNESGSTTKGSTFPYHEPGSGIFMVGCNFTFTGLFFKDK